MAMDASNPIEKRELARRGLRLLDEAVASSPQDTAVRMLRNSAAPVTRSILVSCGNSH
ncbi:hypothetical protein MGA3_17039 [Bacillus methanolicus MGA3]|nr:hypothetical protein MGA3_17039 [Bacillus methanolicus MGA3]